MVWDLLKFSKKLRKKDYEKELEELQAKITQVEAAIKKNRVRESSFSSNWLLYSFLLYLLTSALVYTFSPLEWGPFRFLPLAIGPVIIYLGKRFLKIFFQRKIKSLETFLDFLKTELKSKVEEIKNNEPYNKAKQLLERYDTKKEEPVVSSPAGQPIRHRVQPGVPAPRQGMQAGFHPPPQAGIGGPQPQGMPPGVLPGVGPSQQRPGLPPSQGYPPHLHPQQRASPPANPTWVDKLVEYAVGDSQAANMNNMLEKVQKENITLRNTVADLQRELMILKNLQMTAANPDAQPKTDDEEAVDPTDQENLSSPKEEPQPEENPSPTLQEVSNNEKKEE